MSKVDFYYNGSNIFDPTMGTALRNVDRQMRREAAWRKIATQIASHPDTKGNKLLAGKK